jgi:hypothetical protein
MQATRCGADSRRGPGGRIGPQAGRRDRHDRRGTTPANACCPSPPHRRRAGIAYRRDAYGREAYEGRRAACRRCVRRALGLDGAGDHLGQVHRRATSAAHRWSQPRNIGVNLWRGVLPDDARWFAVLGRRLWKSISGVVQRGGATEGVQRAWAAQGVLHAAGRGRLFRAADRGDYSRNPPPMELGLRHSMHWSSHGPAS